MDKPKTFECRKCGQTLNIIYRNRYWAGDDDNVCFDCGMFGWLRDTRLRPQTEYETRKNTVVTR